jgi:hypothetical protein
LANSANHPEPSLFFYRGVKGRYARDPHPFGFDGETVKIRMRLPVAPLTLQPPGDRYQNLKNSPPQRHQKRRLCHIIATWH